VVFVRYFTGYKTAGTLVNPLLFGYLKRYLNPLFVAVFITLIPTVSGYGVLFYPVF
jgi:hypothetical protein